MDRERHAGERVCNVGRVDPCFRIVAVIVVTVHGQAVGAEEVIVAPVPVLILGADIVVCHSLEQGIFTLSNNLSEVETSINLINGTPEAALYGDNYGDDGMDFDDGMGIGMGTPAMAPMTPAAGVDADDDYDDDDYDDDDYDDDDDFLDD